MFVRRADVVFKGAITSPWGTRTSRKRALIGSESVR
jgi:hypothetical protein